MELSGRVKLVGELMTFDSGFQKKEFVITTQEQYPQDVQFECIKDRVSLVEGLQDGDEVTVHFNIKGREYNGRHFVNLQAWKIDKSSGKAPSPPAEAGSSAPPPDTFIDDEGEDDLPF